MKIHTEKIISIKTYSILAILISLLLQLRIFAQEDITFEKLVQISLEELMQMKVTSASGAETASSGDDFENRSLGWHNSLHPQPGRSFLVNITFNFNEKN